MPNTSVLQPDSTQTFMVKPSYSGTEYYFTAAELMAFVKASYPACDSLILLPYAYSSFGYFIGYFTIGTVNDLNFRNEDLEIAMNCWVAHDALNATTVSFAAINNDGTGLGNQMGSGINWSSLTDQSTSKTWLHIDANFNEPLVLYTECNYTTLYINGVAPTPPGPTPTPGFATVKVTYFLPDYDYTYAKLVYKKDSAPSSETDGTSIEILKDESEVIVENLQGNSKYFFEIFTDKSESDPKDIDIGSVTPAYSVKNLEVLKDFNKTYNILVYTQTAGLYIDMTPQQILDLFNTMYGNYNCIWITYIDYSQGYNIHAAHLEIPGTTLRIYSQEKLVPSITQNGWVFASAFVSSYVESAGHWVARRRSDQSIYLEHEDSLNHWLYTTEVTDPSLSQYSYTAGGGVSPSEPISSSDDTVYIAFYTSLQYTELYIDDIRVQ